MFPGLTENRGTRQRLSASRRGVLQPWSVLPGTWQAPKRPLSTAFSRRSPVPVQPAHSGRPSYGPDGNPGPPGTVLASTSPGAASAFGLPLRPALALSHFRTPHEAPLIGQDASRISEVLGTGIGIHSQVRERRLAD